MVELEEEVPFCTRSVAAAVAFAARSSKHFLISLVALRMSLAEIRFSALNADFARFELGRSSACSDGFVEELFLFNGERTFRFHFFEGDEFGLLALTPAFGGVSPQALSLLDPALIAETGFSSSDMGDVGEYGIWVSSSAIALWLCRLPKFYCV